jgi:hypothetical protein
LELDVKFESERFDSALKLLMKVTGATQEQVIKSEFRSILGKASELTRVADKKKIRARYNFKGEGKLQPKEVKPRVMMDGELVWTKKIYKRGMWVSRKKRLMNVYNASSGTWSKKEKGNYWDPNRINPKFKKLKAIFKKQLNYALSQVGQSKATWVHIAKKLGGNSTKLGSYKVPAYVANVKLPRRLKEKLKVKFGQDPLDYFVEVNNSGDTANNSGSGARGAMEFAFDGRKKFYSMNLSKGVFNTTKKALRAYPELRIELDP